MTSVILSIQEHAADPSVALQIAQALRAELVASEALLAQAGEQFGVPIDALRAALHEPPRLLGMSHDERRRRGAFFRAQLAHALLLPSIVVRAPFGAQWVRGVAHVLRVHLTAPPDTRAQHARQALGGSLPNAIRHLRRLDATADAIAHSLFPTELAEAPFDAVLDASHPQSAVDALVSLASERRFQPTSYSLRCMRDTELACRVRAILARFDPNADVSATDGAVRVALRVPQRGRSTVQAEARELVRALDGVSSVDVKVQDDVLRLHAGEFR